MNHPLYPRDRDRRFQYHPTGAQAENWRRVANRSVLTQSTAPTQLRPRAQPPQTHPHTFPSHVPFMNYDTNPLLDDPMWTRHPSMGGARLVHSFVGVRNRPVYVYENPANHSFIYLYRPLEANAI